MNEHTFTFDVAVVLVVAAVTAMLARAARQPSVLGYLFAGLVVGPYIPIPIFADAHRVESLAEFGVVLVMFAVGLEFRVAKLREVLPTSGLIALLQVGFLFWCGMSLGNALGWTTVESTFLGASICISSTMVVSKVFAERPVSADVRSTVLGILVIQDLLAIVLIAAMTAVAAGGGLTPGELAVTLGKLAAVLLGLFAFGLFIVPRLVRAIIKTNSSELLVVVSVALCFGMAELAAALGYSVALGAFLSGMLVAESGRAHKVEHLVAPLRDVFAAIFFVSIGMTVDPRLAWQHLPVALVVFSVVIVGQFVSVSIAGILSGNGLRRSMTAGLSLGQIGEFAFILAAIGIGANVVRPNLQPILVTVAVLTAFTTPLSLDLAPRLVKFADRHLPRRLRRLISLYEGWIDGFRERSRTASPMPRLMRASRTLLLDAIAFIAVVGITARWHEPGATLLMDSFGLRADLARTAVVGGALALLLPLVLSAVRNAVALSSQLADEVLPTSELDPLVARVSQRTLRVVLMLGITLGIGVPTVAVLRPVVGGVSASVILGVIVLAIFLYLYRSANALDLEFESGAEKLAALLGRQVGDSATAELRDASLLPGLDHARSLLLGPHADAVGKTLGQVNLRVLTGATVVAIHRHDRGAVLPLGDEMLTNGDRLALVGTDEAVSLAATLLELGPEALDERQSRVGEQVPDLPEL